MAYSLRFTLDQATDLVRTPNLPATTATVRKEAVAAPSVIQDRVTLSPQALASSSPSNLLLFAGAKVDTSSDEMQVLQEKGYSLAQIAVELGVPLTTVEYKLGIPVIDTAA